MQLIFWDFQTETQTICLKKATNLGKLCLTISTSSKKLATRRHLVSEIRLFTNQNIYFLYINFRELSKNKHLEYISAISPKKEKFVKLPIISAM